MSLTTVQVLNSHVYLVAIIFGSASYEFLLDNALKH